MALEGLVKRERRRKLERHIQSIAIGVIILLLGWAGKTLETLATKAPEWELRLQNIEISVSGMQPVKDAARDSRRDLQSIETRLTAFELISSQQQVLIERNRDTIMKIEQSLRMKPPGTPPIAAKPATSGRNHNG